MTKVKQTLQINYSDFIKFVRFAIEILYIKPSSLSHNFVFSYATYRHTFRRCLLALGKHAVPSKADIWWRNGNVRGQARSQNDTKKVGKTGGILVSNVSAILGPMCTNTGKESR